MRTYVIRRLLWMIPTILLVTMLVFSVSRLIPGSVLDLMASELAEMGGQQTEVTTDRLKQMLGLDVPVHKQYMRWLGKALKGDLGESLWTGRKVVDDLLSRLPVTLELGGFALIIALLLALPIGTYSAIRQDTIGDYIGRTVAVICISFPGFWIATLVVLFPSIWWSWSPEIGYISPIDDLPRNLVQFIVPGTILGMLMSGTTMRMTRTMMLEVLRQDYIRTAWAKGLTERIVVIRHALKNAFIPVISIIGVLFSVVIGGAVVIEEIFCLPGVGLLLIEALEKRDYPLLSGINLMVAVGVMFINLGVDLSYAWLDPRIKYN